METRNRIEAIISHTMEDFNNSGHFIKEPRETSIKWLTDDLMSIDNVEDLSTIEISLFTLKRLNCLDLINLAMITKTIENGENFDS